MANNPKSISISVVVTAYNRKDFLLDALNSAVNQTLSRDLYEIMCIKNFSEENIDSYISKNKIISIKTGNCNLGEYLKIAAEKANGQVIAFLDDDDVFDSRKLSRVYKLLKSNDIGYYHNDMTREEKDLNNGDIKKNVLKISPSGYNKNYNVLHSSAFCMSAIVIKRSLLEKYSKDITNLKSNPDCFSLSISLVNNVNILIDNNKLTFYRVHANNTSKQNDLTKAIESEISLNIPSLKFIREIIAKSNSNLALLFLDTVIFQAQTRLDMLKGDKSGLTKDTGKFFKEYGLKLLRNKPFLRRVMLILVFFVYKNYAIKRFLS